jgi:hypothetical protein
MQRACNKRTRDQIAPIVVEPVIDKDAVAIGQRVGHRPGCRGAERPSQHLQRRDCSDYGQESLGSGDKRQPKKREQGCLDRAIPIGRTNDTEVHHGRQQQVGSGSEGQSRQRRELAAGTHGSRARVFNRFTILSGAHQPFQQGR